jgi:hypothetical protein
MSVRRAWLPCGLIAAVFVSAAPAAAPALPARFECRRVSAGTGTYLDAKCTESAAPGMGRFDAVEGIGKGKPFKGKAIKPILRSPPVGGEILCKSGTEVGKWTSPTTVGGVVLSLTSCSSLGKKCTSSGAKAGKITTAQLGGTLGYVSRLPLRVGLDLSSETGDVMDLSCEGLLLAVGGSLITELTGNIDSFSTTSQSAFKVREDGSQELRSLEGAPVDVLEGTVSGSGPFEFSLDALFSLKAESSMIGA